MGLKTTRVNFYQRLFFWSILVFAFFIRCIFLSDIPTGVNQDEAMAAVDALALSNHGTDRYGMQWPVHFQAWRYGQMSVLLSYCMIPFIKTIGFSTVAVRIPMVLASVGGIALIYLSARKLFSNNMALMVMAFAAINPWHFMQSRWSLDCNLFPHVFLLGFYLLLCGLEKRKYLYLSMVFFGLTFYCYGIAVYSVPVFLLVYAIWCLWKKEFSLKDILISMGIFLLVALPEILTMLINMFQLSSIETAWFTIPYFPESIRSQDILLINFSFRQLAINIWCMIRQVFLQRPDYIYNALPFFGPMYHISTPFMCLGIVLFTLRFLTSAKKAYDKAITRQMTLDLALLGFLCVGFWAGAVTYRVNINRINIIFYPLMFFAVYGMMATIEYLTLWLGKTREVFITNNVAVQRVLTTAFLAVYSISGIVFFSQYFRSFPDQIKTMFHADFLAVVKEADKLEDYETLYITSNMGWQNSKQISEILTQYSCQIDALYYQGLTNETEGRTLPSYHERYCFTDLGDYVPVDRDALYVIARGELAAIESVCTDGYDVIVQHGDYLAVDIK